MRGRKIDRLGLRYGRLVAIKYLTGKESPFQKASYLCLCDCGKEKIAPSSALGQGYVRSCGCLITDERKANPHNQKAPGESGLTYAYCASKAGAHRLKREFSLTKDEYKEIVIQRCFYCGRKPFNIVRVKTKGMSAEGIKNSEFTCHGIDRVDNSVGYVVSNCVPACFPCNKMKGVFTEDEFLEHIARITSWQSRILPETNGDDDEIPREFIESPEEVGVPR